MAAALLAGCAFSSDPITPEREVVDAVDQFLADNTGSFEVAVDLDDQGTYLDRGAYRVTPDAAVTLRRFTAERGGFTRRFLRLNTDVWVEIPGSDRYDVRTGCWLHGDPASRAELVRAAGTRLGFSTAAVEVALSLRDGREVDGTLVADADLRSLATALSPSAIRGLALKGSRIDVPVTVTIDDGRLTSWRVSVPDLVEAARAAGADDIRGRVTDGEIVATFTDPDTEVDLTPPPEDVTFEAGDPATDLDQLPTDC